MRLITLLLPLVAFAAAAYLRFGSGLAPAAANEIDSADYFGLLLFTTIVWAVVVDQFKLAQFDVYFAARNSASTALGACAATYVAVLGAKKDIGISSIKLGVGQTLGEEDFSLLGPDSKQ